MTRRELIALLGSTAATCPLGARAQQNERMRRIGVLYAVTEDNPEGQARRAAFLQGPKELGWVEGSNIRIDYRWGALDAEHAGKYAEELVALRPDVILTAGEATLAALQRATRTIPIVFAQVPDAVGAGFVNSLARPGRNITGFSTYEYGLSGKWLELLKQVAPGITRAAVLRDPTVASGTGQLGALQTAAPSFDNRIATR
jgi:putative tryptophan/tyrosine transport system substrate-binding protein